MSGKLFTAHKQFGWRHCCFNWLQMCMCICMYINNSYRAKKSVTRPARLKRNCAQIMSIHLEHETTSQTTCLIQARLSTLPSTATTTNYNPIPLFKKNEKESGRGSVSVRERDGKFITYKPQRGGQLDAGWDNAR